jgi:hypothetical protein
METEFRFLSLLGESELKANAIRHAELPAEAEKAAHACGRMTAANDASTTPYQDSKWLMAASHAGGSSGRLLRRTHS